MIGKTASAIVLVAALGLLSVPSVAADGPNLGCGEVLGRDYGTPCIEIYGCPVKVEGVCEEEWAAPRLD